MACARSQLPRYTKAQEVATYRAFAIIAIARTREDRRFTPVIPAHVRRLASEGTALLWRSDFHNARQLLQADPPFWRYLLNSTIVGAATTALTLALAIPCAYALQRLRDTMRETEAYGFQRVRDEQVALGRAVRELTTAHGFPSVAAAGFQAPGVVVSHTTDADIQSSKKFLAVGLQTAAGVPLQCDEGPDFRTFRIGLFGLDKWHDVPATAQRLERALQQVAPVAAPAVQALPA